MPKKSSLFKIRKPRLSVGPRGVKISSPSARIGGKSGLNISKSGVSYSLRTKAGTINTKKGCMRSLFILAILVTISCSLFLPQHLKPQDVIDSFLDAGLVAEGVFKMEPGDYGFAPLADEGLRFLIPSICPDCGGRVLYYEDLEYLEKAKEYYDLLGKETAVLYSWVFIRDHILVQINGDLPKDTALKYEEALKNAK